PRVFLVEILHVQRPIARNTAVAGRVVDQLEGGVAHIVVDRLRYADRDQVQAGLGGEVSDLMRCVHRVVAADVKEVADVVRLHHVDHALEVFLLAGLELVAARPNRPGGGRRPQQCDLARILRRKVEQLFLEHAFDPVPAAVDRPEHIWIVAAGFDHPTQRVVDDGRRPAGLSNNHIFGHTRLILFHSPQTNHAASLPTRYGTHPAGRCGDKCASQSNRAAPASDWRASARSGTRRSTPATRPAPGPAHRAVRPARSLAATRPAAGRSRCGTAPRAAGLADRAARRTPRGYLRAVRRE